MHTIVIIVIIVNNTICTIDNLTAVYTFCVAIIFIFIFILIIIIIIIILVVNAVICIARIYMLLFRLFLFCSSNEWLVSLIGISEWHFTSLPF